MPLVSPRNNVWRTSGEILIMSRQYPLVDLGSTFDCLKHISFGQRPIKSTTPVWVVTCQILRSFLRHHFAGKPGLVVFFQPWDESMSESPEHFTETGNRRKLPPNDIWETSAEILYWWRVTTQICVVPLIGWIKFPTRLDQSKALPRPG